MVSGPVSLVIAPIELIVQSSGWKASLTALLDSVHHMPYKLLGGKVRDAA